MVAILRDNLKRVTINIKVGKVVKSVGRGIYKEIKIIKIESAIEMVSIKSKMAPGSGTIIIPRTDITKNTTPRSLDCIIRLSRVFVEMSADFFAKS